VNDPMQEIKEASARLNALTDSAAEKVKSIELFLESLGIGFPVSVLLQDGNANYSLGYVPTGKRYRLAVRTGSGLDNLNFTPWAECSRSVKLTSLIGLPILITRIKEELKKQIVYAENAVSNAELVMKMLNTWAIDAAEVPPRK
jgi:hypothetical protein